MKTSSEAYSVPYFLKEYLKKISDDDLRILSSRASQLLCGDRGDILNILSQNKEVDRWFQSAEGSDELFEMVDAVGDLAVKEGNKRFGENA